MSAPELTCPRCGSRYKATAFGGGCPRCLLAAAPSGSGFSRGEILAPEDFNAVLPDYEVAELVGHGGMGAVYRARQMDLDREVALKLLTPQAGEDPEFAARFAREAKVLGRLAHPNIVPVYGIGVSEDGLPFYSMKLVKGRTLQEILTALRAGDAGTLRTHPLGALLTIFRKVCDAVAFAHSQDIIHRDLKPANVMVGEFGEVLVMDWGLAKVSGAQRNPTDPTDQSELMNAPGTTLAGAVLGTPHYMSPEQARGETETLDARADIYALGGILYAILTLRPPVEGSTMAEIIEKARSGTVIAPTHHRSTGSGAVNEEAGAPVEPGGIRLRHLPGGRVPSALSAVVMKALAREKADRYQTVAAFQTDIESWQGGFATRAENAGTWTQLKLLMRRHRVVTAMLALLIAVSAGFFLKVLASERRATRNADLAHQNEQQAIAEKEATRRALAQSQIAVADAAALRLDSAGLRAALDACPADLRDSTWHYLAAKTNAALAELPGIRSYRIIFRRAAGGEFFLSDRERPVVHVVQAASGKVLREIKVRASGSKMLSLGSGERELLVSTPDGDLEILDCETGASLARLKAPGTRLGLASLSDDGQRICLNTATPGQNTQLLCMARDGVQILWKQEQWHSFWASRDGEWLLAMNPGVEKTASVIRAATGETVSTMEPGHSYLFDVSFSEDNERLAGADFEGYATVWDRRRGRRLQSFRACAGKLLGAAFTTNGTLITRGQETADTSSPHLLHAWNVERVVALQAISGVPVDGGGFALDPATGHLCTTGVVTQFWQFPVQRHRLQIPLSTPAVQMSFANSGHLVTQHGLLPAEIRRLSAEGSTRVQVPREAGPIFAASGDATRVLFSDGTPNRTRMAQLRDNGAIEWQTPPWKMVTRTVALDRTGAFALANDVWTKVRLYDPDRAEPLLDLTYPDVIMWKQQSFADGERLLLAHGFTGQKGVRRADVIACWDRTTGALLHHLETEAVILTLAVSPDGTRFAWAGSDKFIHLHRAADFMEVRVFRAHDAAINGLAWHPTQPVLASVSDDLSLKLWNPDTGQHLSKALGLSRSLLSTAFSPDGETLAAGTADPATLIFDTAALIGLAAR